jgi:hypothetical protein
MVDPNNFLMDNPDVSDEEKDYIKANITNVSKMKIEDFQSIYDEYLNKFYEGADSYDNQIKALKIHIDKGFLNKKEAIEALTMLQGQDPEDYEDDDLFLAENKLVKEEITDAVDWNFEESIERIIGELKEYQKVNPQDDLQIAINHLEYLV